MSHQDTYRHNEAYAEFLAGWDAGFYARYADALNPGPGARALDVGCGVGQVVGRLSAAGCEVYGVDVSEPNIERARKISERCRLYDGRRLPFEDGFFARVGTLNVLEHVEEPESFIRELVRVTQAGGRVVISSPNFLRVIGPGYHPRMRGIGNRWRNLRLLLEKRRLMLADPGAVRFERMPAIVRTPFQPDDDAIIATNPLEIAFFLRQNGCTPDQVLCTDRYVARPVDWVLNATPLRYVMFNAFVVATKRGGVSGQS